MPDGADIGRSMKINEQDEGASGCLQTLQATVGTVGHERYKIKIPEELFGVCVEYIESIDDHDYYGSCIFKYVPV